VSSKKRSSGKRKVHRQGISGNPQRRAEQLRQERPPVPDRAALRELAYKLAGGAKPAAWWPESRKRIIDRARALIWPSRLVDLETQACQIVGDEFYDRLNSPDAGLQPIQWLRALAEETGAALRAELAEGSGNWQELWALLCGLALMAPRPDPDATSEDAQRLRGELKLPDIKDPLQIALAEAAEAAKLLANRELTPGISFPADGWRPAGEPRVTHDVYGSRFLLVAPFGYEGDAPDHWYAWDIDLCWIDVVVGAGVFSSAEEALGEWRGAVGPAASDAALSPSTAEMTTRLLTSALETGPLGQMLEGSESRELLREYYRLRRRARDLTGPADDTPSSRFNTDQAYDEFQDWYAARHDDAPKAATVAADIILDVWGPTGHPDERSFYACSPHRIEMAARLIRDGYFADEANQALRLLPEWTQWCAEHSGLDGDAAARSREAARAAAAALVDGDDRPAVENDEAPFRRQE
jgi:hypothetical protein